MIIKNYRSFTLHSTPNLIHLKINNDSRKGFVGEVKLRPFDLALGDVKISDDHIWNIHG